MSTLYLPGKKVHVTIDSSTSCESVSPAKLMKRVKDKFKFSRVSESYVCRIVMNFKPKSSSGIDNISNNLLKDLISVIKSPLCTIINRSLEDGIFPNLLKIVKILPLHKGGQSCLPDNYRPISLLPVISKVFERVVYDGLVKHLEKNSVVCLRQFSFRKDHSTIDVICNLSGDIMSAFEGDQMLLGVFIDLRKAFDTVSHSVILGKLEHIGVRDIELQWFRSFLCEHRQCVQLGEKTSKLKQVDIGVAQGSLLSVLLFQLLINDLPKCLKFCSSILYADDTMIYLVGCSLRYLKIKVQNDLESLSKWLAGNSLKLNVSKTKCVLFNKEGLMPNIELSIDNEIVECVEHFKFLGMTLDNRLHFDRQYDELYNKLLKSSFVIRSMSRFVPESCSRYLYYAYCHSHLTYGLLVWWPMLSSTSQDMLIKLQKQIVRGICRVSINQHCMPLFKQKQILTIKDQLTLENCKLMHRVEYDQCPIMVRNLFNTHSKTYETRGSSITALHYKGVKVNKSFLCRPIYDWQLLPINIRKIENRKSFSRCLKRWIICKY